MSGKLPAAGPRHYLSRMNTKRTRSRLPFLGVFIGSAIALSNADSIQDDVKEHIRRRVDDGGAAGIVLGVVTPGGTDFFCYGVTARDGAKLDADSVFEIGSISKVFTSMLLADAVLAGRLKLDDPAASLLPASVKTPQKDDTTITLEHLASHRSGLPRMPDNFAPKDESNPYADYGKEQLYEFLNGCKLVSAPGEKYAYSNLGAGLLGHVLCLKSAKTYDDLLAQTICGPAGMKHTACKLSADMKNHLALGHSGGKAVSNWDLDCLEGAGGIRSTARDMAAFVKACMLSDGKLAALVARCVEKRYPAGGDKMDIGLGWHIDKRYEQETTWHNGGTGGYHSYCGFRADRKLGVVVLTNCDEDIDDIGEHVLSAAAPLSKIRRVLWLEPAKLDEYVGYYELRRGVLLHVARDGAGLTAQLTGQEAVPLLAEAEDRLFVKVVDAQLSFARGDDGKVKSATLHQGGRDQEARRLAKEEEPRPRTEVAVDPKILAEYVGKYALGPATFDIKLSDGKLTAQLTGQRRFPVFAESETKFYYKVVDAQLTFVRDDAGKVAALILHQNGMDQRAERVD
ncbi:D-alanyl-D-alanine-carboxypeptidase/endopeptidase AmpH precursor [Phycisphaerae bacterium RAS1]|nr:D-alanyl-D-alanine-carboxypeptidase/endopeptidase AmpH precursor [Phycisphaerae bacterium RAS1]